MVKYQCQRCHKVFDRKSSFEYHVYKRKTPCDVVNINDVKTIDIEAKKGVKSSDNLHKKCPEQNDHFGVKSKDPLSCPHCNKCYTSKYSLKRHIDTKCGPEFIIHNLLQNLLCQNDPGEMSDNSYSDVSETYDCDIIDRGNSNYAENRGNYSENVQISAELCKRGVFTPSNSKRTFECNYCLKGFSRKYNLERHLNGRCKVKKSKEIEMDKIYKNLVDKIEKKEQELDKLRQENRNLKTVVNIDNRKKIDNSTKTINNINNNSIMNTNNNNHNSVSLVAFGHEDMSYLSNKACKTIMKKGYQSIPNLVQNVHFHKNRPQNHNVYIPNMRDKYAMAYDGSGWNLVDKNEIIDQLFGDKSLFLQDKYRELYNELDESVKRKIELFFENEDDDEVKRFIKEEIKLLIYNKKDVPMKTKKTITN